MLRFLAETLIYAAVALVLGGAIGEAVAEYHYITTHPAIGSHR